LKFAYQFTEKKEPVTIWINELPVMVNEANELVCIPHSIDMPVIGTVGKRASGKSYMNHSMIDRIYWYWKEPLLCMNDLTHELISWGRANSSKQQIELLAKYGESPKPLPIVYLYPHFKNIILPDHDFYELSIPFEFFLQSAPYFLDLKKSADHLKLNLKYIMHCKSPEEIQEELSLRIKNKNIVQTIMVSLRKYVDEELTDFNSNALSYVDVGDYASMAAMYPYAEMEEDKARRLYPPRKYGPIPFTKEQFDYFLEDGREIGYPIESGLKYYWSNRSRYTPMLGFARQNLIPVLNTEQLRSKKYFHSYMYYLLDVIINNQSRDKYWSTNSLPVWLFFDEVTRVASTTLKKETTDKLREIAQSGRPLRMGLLYVTQDYVKVDSILRSQTTYLFSFRFTAKSQAKTIRDDMHLSEYEEEEILSLRKHEVLGMTSEHFVVYSPDGQRYETEKTQKGISLPPLSEHSRPRSITHT